MCVHCQVSICINVHVYLTCCTCDNMHKYKYFAWCVHIHIHIYICIYCNGHSETCTCHCQVCFHQTETGQASASEHQVPGSLAIITGSRPEQSRRVALAQSPSLALCPMQMRTVSPVWSRAEPLACALPASFTQMV